MDVIGVAYVWQMISGLDRASIVIGGVLGLFFSILWMMFFRLDRTTPLGIKRVAAVQVLIVAGFCLIAWWPSLAAALASVLP
jgi:hypothetical protein